MSQFFIFFSLCKALFYLEGIFYCEFKLHDPLKMSLTQNLLLQNDTKSNINRFSRNGIGQICVVTVSFFGGMIW